MSKTTTSPQGPTNGGGVVDGFLHQPDFNCVTLASAVCTPEGVAGSAAKVHARSTQARMETAKTVNTLPPSSTRTNPVNELYAQWKNASFEEKESILRKLEPLLMSHASRMVWMILRQTNTQLVREMVDDLVMTLDVFEGRSQFSTWVHSRFRYRCIDELRYRRKFLGDSLDQMQAGGFQYAPVTDGEKSAHDALFIEARLQTLAPEDEKLIRLRLGGADHHQIAKEMGRNGRWVFRQLIRLERELEQTAEGDHAR